MVIVVASVEVVRLSVSAVAGAAGGTEALAAAAVGNAEVVDEPA